MQQVLIELRNGGDSTKILFTYDNTAGVTRGCDLVDCFSCPKPHQTAKKREVIQLCKLVLVVARSVLGMQITTESHKTRTVDYSPFPTFKYLYFYFSTEAEE